MLYKGNKKIRKLYKGDKLLTQVYKGDEIIYQDIESLYGLKFTINTAYGYNQAPVTSSSPEFRLGAEYTSSDEKFIVDWGDGTRQEIWNQNVTHTYPSHGEYQITLIPSVFVGSKPIKGWMRGLYFPSMTVPGTSYSMPSTIKIKSFDSPIPDRALLFAFQAPSGVKARNKIPYFFNGAYHLETVPDGFFDKIEFYSPGERPASLASAFASQFYGAGMYTNLDVFSVAKKWFRKFTDNIDTSAATSFLNTFYQTFSGCLKVRTIPADLFSGFDTSSGEDFTNMFYSTFGTGLSLHYSEPRGNEIPGGLFSFLNTSNGKSFSSMFDSTFLSGYPMSDAGTGDIPQNLFASLDTTNGTNFSSMFKQTFTGHGYNRDTKLVLDGLFDSIQTPRATNVANMFNGTFSDASYRKGKTIAQGFFDGLDTSGCTSTEGMFCKTFNTQGGDYSRYSSSETPIPVDLFYGLDTRNVINFKDMFNSTFDGGMFQGGIPDLFAHLNTSNGVNFSGMFKSTFASAYAPSIPETLFTPLSTTNGANFSNMFDFTFALACANSTTAVFPEHLFDFLDTPNATNMYNMFAETFRGAFGLSTVAEIPAALFQGLDTSNVTDFRGLFSGTFNSCFQSAAPNVPANLFSKVDVSRANYVTSIFYNTFYGCFGTNSTKTYTIPATLFQRFCQTLPSTITSLSMSFRGTFFDFCKRDVVVTVPATLFTGLNTPNVTNFYQAFCETFQGVNVYDIPLGLLGGLDLTAGTNFTDTFTNMFSTYTGSQMPGGTLTYTTVFNDVFDGMTNFSWATAVNAQQLFRAMFSVSSQNIVDASVGSASDILQHFNFVPNTRTTMFYGRTNLSDYATINANWK